ncbi:MAG: CoA transferase, partial [Acidimicrobiales bacterium]
FYCVYETADGGHVAVGALEPRFYAELLVGLGLQHEGLPAQADRSGWPVLRRRFAEVFAGGSREEWAARFAGTDACVAPVLGLAEAPSHPQNQSRSTFLPLSGTLQPAPAPRFSRTSSELRLPPPRPGEHTDEVLSDWGFTASELSELHACGALR